MARGLRIALIGTRGVPARYGGFETCAEEVGRRLAGRGHDVRVYCRPGYAEKRLRSYEGMTLIYLPALRSRTLETLSHTALSLLHAGLRDNDVCLVFNTANLPFLWVPRLFGKKVVLHTDGLEWAREKWPGAGRRYFQWAERRAARLSIPLVSDSRAIQSYFKTAHRRETNFIAYGAPIVGSRDRSLLAPLGLEPGEYFLQMARFEPENNVHLTVEAFAGLDTSKKLALIGGAAYASDYMARLRSAAGPRVVFLGFVYDRPVVEELLTNCFAYVHGNEAGGTNPGLLQAMGAGCAVISRDVVFNREVCGRTAVYFAKDAGDLRAKMGWALGHEAELPAMREASRARVRDRYDWDAVTDDYERLFLSL